MEPKVSQIHGVNERLRTAGVKLTVQSRGGSFITKSVVAGQLREGIRPIGTHMIEVELLKGEVMALMEGNHHCHLFLERAKLYT